MARTIRSGVLRGIKPYEHKCEWEESGVLLCPETGRLFKIYTCAKNSCNKAIKEELELIS